VAKILVIDDNPVMLDLYREILTRAGHEVVLAENGTQGLARIDRKPDLVVVDLMMPNLNGYDFVKQLRSMGGQTATLVIAASPRASGPQGRGRPIPPQAISKRRADRPR